MYHDDFDRTRFCNLLERNVRRHAWICHAFCQMTTHYHLLLDVGDNNVQKGMQALNGPYAQAFNARHGRSGHLRGDRYSLTPVLGDGHYIRAFRYIVRNPVRAGICERPSEWQWSSFAGTVGTGRAFPFVDASRALEYFGRQGDEQVRLLRILAGDLEDDL